MKYSDLKPGMKIRATADWGDCWKVGDEFTVYADDAGEMAIYCHDPDNGPHHGLMASATDDGDLPEFAPVDG
jgi:hypothetical protein